jgi:hypothetical protein
VRTFRARSCRCFGAPSAKELEALVGRIAERIGQALERKRLLVRDYEQSYLAFDPATGGPMDDLLGHSITCRVAMGPRAGQKVFRLQAVPAELRKGATRTAPAFEKDQLTVSHREAARAPRAVRGRDPQPRPEIDWLV